MRIILQQTFVFVRLCLIKYNNLTIIGYTALEGKELIQLAKANQSI